MYIENHRKCWSLNLFHYLQEELKSRKLQLFICYFGSDQKSRDYPQFLSLHHKSHSLHQLGTAACNSKTCQWGLLLPNCTKFTLVQATVTSCLDCHIALQTKLAFNNPFSMQQPEWAFGNTNNQRISCMNAETCAQWNMLIPQKQRKKTKTRKIYVCSCGDSSCKIQPFFGCILVPFLEFKIKCPSLPF